VLGTVVMIGFADFITWLGEKEQPVASFVKIAVK
jgi:hypothetical protein